MISYKQIIRNMIDIAIREYVEEKSGSFAHMKDEDAIEMIPDKELGHPRFTAQIMVEYKDFTIVGYVDDYGMVHITSVRFDRLRCTEKDEDGWWITESAKPVHEFLFGDKLDEFKFDR